MKVVINHDFKDENGKEFKKADTPNIEFNAAKELIHQGLAAAVDSQEEIGKQNTIQPTEPAPAESIVYTNKEGDDKHEPDFVKEDAKKSKK